MRKGKELVTNLDSRAGEVTCSSSSLAVFRVSSSRFYSNLFSPCFYFSYTYVIRYSKYYVDSTLGVKLRIYFVFLVTLFIFSQTNNPNTLSDSPPLFWRNVHSCLRNIKKGKDTEIQVVKQIPVGKLNKL